MARGKRVSTKESNEVVSSDAAASQNVQVTTTEEAAPAAAPAAADESLNQLFTNLIGQIAELKTQLTSLSSQVRTLRTRSEREIRAAQKAGRRRRNANRKPSGFQKPAPISDELAAFLNRPSGTEIARTEVTKEIHRYIREHKLQDPNDGRVIIPDARLRKLLRLTKGTQFAFFNLQKYMTPHFPKKESAETTATA